MKLSYFPTPYPEAEIAATPAEFAVLAARVAELARSGTGDLTVSGGIPGLASLVIRVDSGPVLVAVEGEVLTISGGAQSVELFGQNFPDHDSLPPNYHIHYEHSTRESDVAAESIPLVLLVASGKSTGG